ncbi:hypothetical protein ACFSKI_01730 [Pseudogracilibacillus auburnensis]|uniref:Uncharacterized protein n=1 Tax=Pseudogracilibacillus auburnensis TaxID=1494959 RepID=A0A2V3VF10_9BACI|nr:hypothetical protein [Pseudogracilibacillus auburnensis]MBO1004373.1 hypothetical protein [Pseudogracilibacillus auburnensis]PXW80406.1 hypothetical protein DFR56_12822 [Pseudogracilibacillus auburnensis]
MNFQWKEYNVHEILEAGDPAESEIVLASYSIINGEMVNPQLEELNQSLLTKRLDGNTDDVHEFINFHKGTDIHKSMWETYFKLIPESIVKK